MLCSQSVLALDSVGSVSAPLHGKPVVQGMEAFRLNQRQLSSGAESAI